jgi:hypothetical protein
MNESIGEHHLGPGPLAHFSVDTSLPYHVVEKQFRENFERLNQKKHKALKLDGKRFAKWCDYGLLPYIDLKQEELFESGRNGSSKLAITNETMAEAIYKSLLGTKCTANTVTDTTKLIAEEIMKPSSPLFRQLLAEASAEGSRQFSMEHVFS